MLTTQFGGPTGIGPFLEGTDEGARFSHGGGNAGFLSQLEGYRTGGFGAVVMVNADFAPAVAEIVQTVADVYRWPQHLPHKEREVVEVEGAGLDALCGHYQTADGLSIEATAEAEDDWVAQVNEAGEATLFPLANSWYVGANVPGKPRVFTPYIGGLDVYEEKCNEVVATGYAGFALSAGEVPATT